MKTFVWLFVLTCFLSAAVLRSSHAEGRTLKPNFILFYTDDQGWADTSVRMMTDRADSCSSYYQTPHLEKLAKEGMVFSNAYSPTPVCTPSRISIQFGKTPAKLGQTTVHDVLAKVRGKDCRDEISIAQIVKAADSSYRTAHFGKGIVIRRMKDLGYDFTDEFDRGDNGNYHGDYRAIDDRRPLPEDDPKRIFSLTGRANSFMKEQVRARRPFFMQVSHYAVHVGHMSLKSTREKYRRLPRGPHCRDKDYQDPKTFSEGYIRSSWTLNYAAMIEDLDSSLGSIMKTVDLLGIRNNTYIIFTSDNGGGFHGNAPLRAGKANIFEGGIRVPTVVRGPGVLAGTQCDVPVIQWDILPTIHDLIGSEQPLPDGIDGGSWRDVFKRGNDGLVKRDISGLVFHFPWFSGVAIQAIRIGDYKYMRHLNTGETRLFNLAKDLGEERDLSKTMPEKVREYDTVLQRYLKGVDAGTLDEMYKVRENELKGYIRRMSEQTIPKLEAKVAKADGAEKRQLMDQLAKSRKRLPELKESLKKAYEFQKHTQWE